MWHVELFNQETGEFVKGWKWADQQRAHFWRNHIELNYPKPKYQVRVFQQEQQQNG